jgi:hypothetical protein
MQWYRPSWEQCGRLLSFGESRHNSAHRSKPQAPRPALPPRSAPTLGGRVTAPSSLHEASGMVMACSTCSWLKPQMGRSWPLLLLLECCGETQQWRHPSAMGRCSSCLAGSYHAPSLECKASFFRRYIPPAKRVSRQLSPHYEFRLLMASLEAGMKLLRGK